MHENWPHGGALDQMMTLFPDAPKPWIDLSTGINPWPYPIPDMPHGLLHHLPTRAAQSDCLNALSHATSAPPESICLAPGSELVIRLLPRALPAKRIAILNPTYGDYQDVWRRSGCDVVESDDPLSLASEVDAIVICNPNNPDGLCVNPDALMRAHATLQKRKGWLIVDEAYGDMSPELSLALHGGSEGLVVLRSFGKFFGLAGLRLGALIGPVELVAWMRQELGIWPVSSLALEIGCAAWSDMDWQAQTRLKLKNVRRRLDERLTDRLVGTITGTDLFRYVQVSDATATWNQLAHAGIYVRRFEGDNHHLRIGLPPNPNSEDRLIGALNP